MNWKPPVIMNTPMSLVMCLKASDGLVFVADSRTLIQDSRCYYEDTADKIFLINKNVLAVAAGDTNYAYVVIEKLREVNEVDNLGPLKVAEKVADLAVQEAISYESRRFATQAIGQPPQDVPNYAFIIGGYEKNEPKIYSYHLGNRAPQHQCDYYAEGVKHLVPSNLSKKKYSINNRAKEVVEIAKYIIEETVKESYAVGLPVKAQILSRPKLSSK